MATITLLAGFELTRVVPWWPFCGGRRWNRPTWKAEFAAFIQRGARDADPGRESRHDPQQFFVIASVRHPAVLVEGGFLTNADELNKLATGDYREQIAAAISDGVLRYREILKGREMALAVDLPGDNSTP